MEIALGIGGIVLIILLVAFNAANNVRPRPTPGPLFGALAPKRADFDDPHDLTGNVFFEHVVGEQHGDPGEDRQGVIAKLKAGSPLTFQREPTNRFDKNAVAVLAGGQRIGYLPKTVAPAVAEWMDNTRGSVTGQVRSIKRRDFREVTLLIGFDVEPDDFEGYEHPRLEEEVG